ncbi:hypothetical protein AAP_06255 [Ascosphaera apis ARSEF 7405]|uniref:Uncharacterized protein n=1 Tax=Ascosphaera apis ARSEF 7405 TaxID=392613 RepID=A0A167UYM3_9EURO|nr:hypothetical protein AAP_06255 [Ascosphaera apis ARSEF 7405]
MIENLATIVEDSQTPPESKCQFTPKNSDKENDKRRVGAATTGSSQAARSRSQTASIATSYKGSSIGIGAGNDQHVENAASPPSSGVAPSSSPGSPTEEAQDVRRAANSTADVTENTTMKSSAASSAQDNSQSSVSSKLVVLAFDDGKPCTSEKDSEQHQLIRVKNPIGIIGKENLIGIANSAPVTFTEGRGKKAIQHVA